MSAIDHTEWSAPLHTPSSARDSSASDDQSTATARFLSSAGGLVVSVQASEGSALRSTPIIVALARAAVAGGAQALRVNGPADVAGVREATRMPVIGLHKIHNGHRNLITPTMSAVHELAVSGADMIAMEATRELHGNDFSLIARARAEFDLPVMADVSTLDEGLRAWDAGADLVATTLSGYTAETTGQLASPDIELVARLAEAGIRVVAEGRYRTPAQAAAARSAGAWAIVVGGAITDPTAITASFVTALQPHGHALP